MFAAESHRGSAVTIGPTLSGFCRETDYRADPFSSVSSEHTTEQSPPSAFAA